MPLTLFHLAQLEKESGNLREGIQALRKAIALVPDNTETVAMLGAFLTQDGQAAEAVALLDPFARGQNADVDVLTARAIALAKLGRFDEALSDLSRAQAQDASNARLLVDTVRSIDDARLDDLVPGEEGAWTVYDTIQGAIEHSIYHAGQIAILKKGAGR